MYTIEKEKIVFDDVLKIEQAKISNNDNKTFKKLRVKREDAAAVLILNTDSDRFILTRQFRYPIASQTTEQILEIAAGKIDEGESPIETAIRETKEETGYVIARDHIRPLVSCFASPGYSSEQFHLFFAIVCNADKVAKGGGLEEENEHIEVVEMKASEFLDLVRNGKIKDAKTYLAGLIICNELQQHNADISHQVR